MGTLVMGALLGLSASQVVAGQAHASPAGAYAAARLAADVTALTITPQAYLPMVARQYFKEYTYQDDFSNWASGWPWYMNSVDYGYKQDGDGSKVYHIRMYDTNAHLFVSGPGLAVGNFDYQAQVREATTAQPLWWGDEYGILLSPAPIDPNNPSGGPVYTFQVQLHAGSGLYPLYAIKKWTDLAQLQKTLIREETAGDWLTNLPKFWNRLRIVRSGNTLDFFISRQEGTGWTAWQHVYTYTDSGLPAELYVGFCANHAEEGAYTIEFQFDNLWLHAYP
jgi:hypothetical protein